MNKHYSRELLQVEAACVFFGVFIFLSPFSLSEETAQQTDTHGKGSRLLEDETHFLQLGTLTKHNVFLVGFFFVSENRT
jgi:hypothetical protein